ARVATFFGSRTSAESDSQSGTSSPEHVRAIPLISTEDVAAGANGATRLLARKCLRTHEAQVFWRGQDGNRRAHGRASTGWIMSWYSSTRLSATRHLASPAPPCARMGATRGGDHLTMAAPLACIVAAHHGEPILRAAVSTGGIM